jgi:hypothetical protein
MFKLFFDKLLNKEEISDLQPDFEKIFDYIEESLLQGIQVTDKKIVVTCGYYPASLNVVDLYNEVTFH